MAEGLVFRIRRRAREVAARFERRFVVRSRLTRPVLSITFDDAAQSAVTTGAAALEAEGVRGTFYLAGHFEGGTVDGLPAYTAADVERLAAAGHEVACHSFAHSRAPEVDPTELDADYQRNVSALGRTLHHHAYPYGEVSPRTKAVAGARFTSVRGIVPGINQGDIDLAQLKAAPLERRSLDHAALERLIDQATAGPGWLIVFSHDVSLDPSPYGCTPDDLTRLIRTARRAGLMVLPVGEAVAAVKGESLARAA